MNRRLVLFSILILALVWSLIQFGKGEGMFDMMGRHHGMTAVPDWGDNPVPSDLTSQNRGKEIFNGRCAMCHGLQGQGDGPVGKSLNPPPANLVHSAKVFDDGKLAGMIAEGRGQMPPFGKALKKENIWDVVNYIRSLE